MSLVDKFSNPYKQTGVILSPVSDIIQNDSNLEPPFVRTRHGNLGLVYLDSASAQGNANDFIIGGKSGSDYLFSQNITRYAVSNIRMSGTTPNVNPYNNGVRVLLSTISNNYTLIFNMTEGYYNTPAEFIAKFTTEINAERLSSGAGGAFTFTVDPVNSDVYTIDAGVGYTFRFFTDCSMIIRGRFLANLPTSQIETQTKQIGAIQLTYTRWIDITSFTLNEHNKNFSTASGKGKPNLLLRLYETPNGLTSGGDFSTISKDRFIDRNNLRWVNYERNKQLTTIDLQLYDEFNNLLYIPTFTDRPSDFYICVEILTEL
jgi:hypothetical protein